MISHLVQPFHQNNVGQIGVSIPEQLLNVAALG